MLIALFTILLLGGGSLGALEYIGDTRGAVKIVVPKGDSQKSALSTLKVMKKRTSAHSKVLKGTMKELERAFSDHDTTVDDLDAIWGEFFVEMNRHNIDMLDLRFELKESISREEWQAIFEEIE